MSVRVYMVRHGQAAAGWDTDPDPPLSELGLQQADAVRHSLEAYPPCSLISSPLVRAQQTAQPLAKKWHVPIEIDAVFREIPAPSDYNHQQRMGWLLSIRNQHWQEASEPLWQWRRLIVQGLLGIRQPAIIFTHFMVLNVVAAVATGTEKLVHYQPDNGSILTLEIAKGRIHLVDWGRQASTQVL